MISSLSEPLSIVYQDRWLCAVDKPCDLMVHRSALGTDRQFALQLLRDQLGHRVWPIHRLDRATSGVLLFALDADTAAALGKQVMARQIDKRYLAVVRGYVDLKPALFTTRPTAAPPGPASGAFRSVAGPHRTGEYASGPLGRETPQPQDLTAPRDGRVVNKAGEEALIDHPLVAEGGKEAQAAQTAYRCLARVEWPIAVGRYSTARYSLVEARPLTGRMHQIRRHFKHIFHPIIGDTTYGEGRHNRLFREHFNCHRLLLHASQLSFRHPDTGQNLTIKAPPTGDLQRVMERFE